MSEKEKNQLAAAPEAAQDPQTTQADLDAIMRKYDRESNVRVWEGKWKILVGIVLAAFSLYCMYVTLFANMLDQVRLSSFLGLVVVAGYLIYPARKGRVRVNHMPWYDIVLMVLGAVAFFYYTFKAPELLTMRIKTKLTDPVYITMGIIGILVLCEPVSPERRHSDPVRRGRVPGLYDLLLREGWKAAGERGARAVLQRERPARRR